MPSSVRSINPQASGTNLAANSPHATWIVVDVGAVSILFSYSRPAGFSIAGRTFTRPGVHRATVKHLNTWRDFRTHRELTELDFDLALLRALSMEAEHLRSEITQPPESSNDAG